MMNDFRADLHCHSTCSDGADSPDSLIHLAKKLNLQGLSITDHDTIAAYQIAVPIAEQIGLSLLPGVEFSASHRGEPVHVLGYAFSLNSQKIKQFCARHQMRRQERNALIIAKLQKLGYSISEKELYSKHNGTVGRPHIAQLLVEKGIVPSMKDAFHRLLGEGKPAYDPGERITVEETLECIQKAGGKAVLAHPHLLQRSTTIRDLLAMSFDGIEGYYAKISADQEKRWIDWGIKKGWLVTGGSDYHGTIKPQIPLGSSWVNKETFQILYEHYLSQSTV